VRCPEGTKKLDSTRCLWVLMLVSAYRARVASTGHLSHLASRHLRWSSPNAAMGICSCVRRVWGVFKLSPTTLVTVYFFAGAGVTLKY